MSLNSLAGPSGIDLGLIAPELGLLALVLGSIALYALATNLAALVVRRAGPASRPARLARSNGMRLASWLAWILWLIGPAYVALLLGDLSPRLMGLSQIDLGAGLGLGALFAILSLAVLLSAVLTYRRAALTSHPFPSSGDALAASVRLVVETGALQWHWAFYRSAIITGLAASGWSTAVYWGTWLAVASICLEGASSPFLWRDLRAPGRAEKRMLRAVLLFATSVLYLLSRNFWLAWALHALATLVVEPRLSPSRPVFDKTKGR